ncbi:MAG: hypothetical protein E6G48_10385 [Actinobacteria bacterium]|nr:MAG: hypothetical protein E6G48_10385 [Actinomycetota bacterium]
MAVLGALALLAVIVALAALLDIGPFGNDGGNSQLSKAQFVAKSDEICKNAHDQFVALQQAPPKTSSEAAALQQKLIAISVNELNQIGTLGAPSDLEPALDRYLRARERGIRVLKEGLKAAQNNDPVAYERSKRKIFQGQGERTRLAHAVGFTVCSSAFSGAGGSGQ